MKGRNMNKNYGQIATEFAADTWFEVRPRPPAHSQAAQEAGLEQLKNQLLQERLEAAEEPGLTVSLRRAADDAAALAWVTPYPLLVFPALFEEKAEAALLRAERQEQIRQRSRELLTV